MSLRSDVTSNRLLLYVPLAAALFVAAACGSLDASSEQVNNCDPVCPPPIEIQGGPSLPRSVVYATEDDAIRGGRWVPLRSRAPGGTQLLSFMSTHIAAIYSSALGVARTFDPLTKPMEITIFLDQTNATGQPLAWI
ncbi:MAG TPA: hypothetical protein VEP48_10135, partial [Methylomirabilota bacterium]|nr:hypothetical protein [Methylomirabilota bacterium]